MNENIHKYLVSVDEVGNWEFPANQDWYQLIEQVQSLKPELEKNVGKSLDIDMHVEDASFLTDISLVDNTSLEQKTNRPSLFSLRFSNFGRMFTILSGDLPTHREIYRLDDVIQFLEAQGYKYIPENELDTLYDGLNTPYQPGLIWWQRYFDYL